MKLFSTKFVKSAVLLALSVIVYSCENDIAVVNSLTVDENTPIESSYDVEMNYTDSGRSVMLMRSPEVNRFPTEEEYVEMPKGMHLVFFDTLGREKSNIKSEYAINYVDKNIMEARINVVATNREGDKLFTELLTWDQKKKQIYTDVPVRVIQDGKTLFGDGLVADETFTDYTIINPHGEFDIEDGSDTETNSQSEQGVERNSTTKGKQNSATTSGKKKKKVEEEDEFGDFDSY